MQRSIIIESLFQETNNRLNDILGEKIEYETPDCNLMLDIVEKNFWEENHCIDENIGEDISSLLYKAGFSGGGDEPFFQMNMRMLNMQRR